MLFTSFAFLLFLLAVIVVYFIWPLKHRWIVLLISSIIFYAFAGLQFLPFILSTTILSFFAAKMIDKEQQNCAAAIENIKNDKDAVNKLKENSKRKCRRYMLAAVLLILAYLMYTKFGRTVIDWIAVAANKGEGFSSAAYVIVPLGISYYSFSTVGYVLDVYWKRYRPESNILKYMLYVMYFPHILQGPIARFNKLGVQFSQEHKFDYKRVCFGIQLMMWGFFQKLFIADRLNLYVSDVFNDCANQYGVILLVAILFYAVQIYTDFAGCVNMARGMSQIFGIEIEDNFRQPYFARSVEEFWRRWHITLGAWFKDYLCMPVSVSKSVKNTSKAIRKRFGSEAGKNYITIVALIAVWISTGVWHGTGLNYIVWAVWQCGIIVMSLLLEPIYVKVKKALLINDCSIEWRAFQIVRTFILTGLIPRIIVRSSTLQNAFIFFKNMITVPNFSALLNGSLFKFGMDKFNFILSILGICILFTVSVLKEKGISIRESIANMHILVRWSIYLGVLYTIIIFGIYGPGYEASAFVYMGF